MRAPMIASGTTYLRRVAIGSPMPFELGPSVAPAACGRPEEAHRADRPVSDGKLGAPVPVPTGSPTSARRPDDRGPAADPLAPFSNPVRAWFESAFETPTPAQAGGWAAISQGAHTLIHAPTGSGKTLAAFLWCLDGLVRRPSPSPSRSVPGTVRVLYVSPLKALTYDVERNLRAPLHGISLAAARLGAPEPRIAIASRTGDTPQEDRRELARRPPDILVTTPESLYLLLTSVARDTLRGVETLIVDEVHAIAGT